MSTVIPQSAPKPAHFHTAEPLVQIGWWGQTGRVYGLDEEEAIRLIERGSYSPIYASWADGPCGHRPKLVTE